MSRFEQLALPCIFGAGADASLWGPHAARRPAVRLHAVLRVNVSCVDFGPFCFDSLDQMSGAKFADLLEPLEVGPVTRRPSEAGPAIEVYLLALPAGKGASIPLGQWREVGFANRDGLLVLTVP